LGKIPRWVPDTKTDSPAGRRSYSFDFDFGVHKNYMRSKFGGDGPYDRSDELFAFAVRNILMEHNLLYRVGTERSVAYIYCIQITVKITCTDI
jgi:hypothetical protein